ncbi:hypothetical protein HaLaN_21997, partial [Haematococcus lacustris]
MQVQDVEGGSDDLSDAPPEFSG